MMPEEYLKLSGVTDDVSPENMIKRADRLVQDQLIHSLHAICGIVTEAGELMDAFKKEAFYGRPMNPTNIKEEIGDVLWYVALLCRTHNLTLEECMEANIAKLKVRYGDKFTEHAALNRNLTKEYASLEVTHKVFRISTTNETDGQHYVTAMYGTGEFSTSPHKADARVCAIEALDTIRGFFRGKKGVDFIFAAE